MIRVPAVFALLLLAAFGLFGQGSAAPATITDPNASQAESATSPYKNGDQVIAPSASVVLPLAMFGGSNVTHLYPGAGFGFGYRYFLDGQWALGGDIDGAFNGTYGGRSLFIGSLSAGLSWWKALVPFEFTLDAGIGGYISRLDTIGYVSPLLRFGGAALWRAGSGWSVGIQAQAAVVPEIHFGTSAGLTRVALFLSPGLVAVYHF